MLTPLYQNPKLSGGPIGWANCFTTCTAMQIAFETAGVKHPDGGNVRACCLDPDGEPDVTGGTRASQNMAAAQRCWGVTLDGRVMAFEDAWKLGAREDYAISVSISYAVISGTKYDGSPGPPPFRGYHQVLLSGGLVYDPLADGRRAGIPKGPQKWPKDLLKRAAGKYSGIGEGRASVLVARAPAVKPKRYSVIFEPGAIFLYRQGAILWKREPDDGVSKRTSAPSTAPFNVPWLAGRKRLVEITAGKYAGQSVEPTATHMWLKEAA